MALLCRLPETVDASASERASVLTREADRLVTNHEVRSWMHGTYASPTERDRKLSELLGRAHITHCWLLDERTDAAVSSSAAAGSSLPDGGSDVLRALAGHWRFPWTKSDAPPDAHETTWDVAGDRLTLTEGSRKRTFTIRIVAGCLAKLVGLRGDTPFVPFVLDKGDLYLPGSMAGFRRGDSVTLCTRGGHVYELTGKTCRGTALAWDEGPAKELTVTCALAKTSGKESFVVKGGMSFEETAFFDGDRLHDTTLPLRADKPVGPAVPQ